ncbi:hypothetical protein MASR1M12_00930 [Erysipelotrichia bacterium]
MSFGAGDYLCVRKNGETHKYLFCDDSYLSSGYGDLKVRCGGVTRRIPLSPPDSYNASSSLRLKKAGQTLVAHPVSVKKLEAFSGGSDDFCSDGFGVYYISYSSRDLRKKTSTQDQLIYTFPSNIYSIACSTVKIFVTLADGTLRWAYISSPSSWYSAGGIYAVSMVWRNNHLYCLYSGKIYKYNESFSLVSTSSTLSGINLNFDIDNSDRVVWSTGGTINISSLAGTLIKSKTFNSYDWGSCDALSTFTDRGGREFIVTSWSKPVHQFLSMELAPVCRFITTIGQVYRSKWIKRAAAGYITPRFVVNPTNGGYESWETPL